MYEAPSITELGPVADMTEALASGALTDAAFPEDTDPADFTFS
ncbi:MAG: hypothetical protein WED83_01420 [Acidimicrobiia bacterium]